MENIIDYLRRRLREYGPGTWDQIAADSGVAKSLPRKIAYGDRGNPGVQTVQPLLNYMQRVERGEISAPNASPRSAT